MANKHRGEVALEVDGVTYILRLSSNALCEMEGVLQRGTLDVFSNLAQIDIRTLRAIFWATLLDAKPGVTLKEAGDIIDAAGFASVVEKIGQLSAVTFPQTGAREAPGENPA